MNTSISFRYVNQVYCSPVWPYRASETPHWIEWAKEFDFAVWLDFAGSRGPVPENLQPWAGGSFFEIYRIKK